MHNKMIQCLVCCLKKKRKRKDAGYQCNGTGSPKRHRESVLRLTGDDWRDAAPTPTHIFLGQGGDDYDLENLDRSIVQFTVGACERTEVLVPFISANEEAALIGTRRRSQSSSQDNASQTSPSEPSESTKAG